MTFPVRISSARLALSAIAAFSDFGLDASCCEIKGMI
jgi:hypothetical protein